MSWLLARVSALSYKATIFHTILSVRWLTVPSATHSRENRVAYGYASDSAKKVVWRIGNPHYPNIIWHNISLVRIVVYIYHNTSLVL